MKHLVPLKKRCHFKSNQDYGRYKIYEYKRDWKHTWHWYLETAGIGQGQRAYTGPTTVQLDVTNRCNNNCLACWLRSPLLNNDKTRQSWEQQELPYKLVIKIIDELARMGTRRIFFAGGGEPFLHPHFMEIVGYALKRGMECDLNTNFTLVNKDVVKELITLNFPHINVSLWSATPATYVRTHPNKTEATFQQIKEMLVYLAHEKRVRHLPHINLYQVIFKDNFHEIETMINLALQVKADSIQFVPMDPVLGKTDCLLLSQEECQQVKEALLRGKKTIEEDIENKAGSNLFICEYEQFLERISSPQAAAGKYDPKVANLPCYAGWKFMRITADGEVYPCLKSSQAIGNVYIQDLPQIWYGQKQNYFRSQSKVIPKARARFSTIDCLATCDNRWINQQVNDELRGLSAKQKLMLRALRSLLNLKAG